MAKRRSLDIMTFRGGGESLTVPLSSIVLPPYQPRQYFDPQKLEQLAKTIQSQGVLQPLVVRRLAHSQYELIAGGRRYRAATIAQLGEVPVTVLDLSDEQALEVALLENIQREDLNPLEETEGVVELLAVRLQVPSKDIPALLYRLRQQEVRGLSNNVVGQTQPIDEVSNNVVRQMDTANGQSSGITSADERALQVIRSVFDGLESISFKSFVSHRLPLLNLPPEILEVLRVGKIEYTKAQAIARLKEPEQRKALLEAAIVENLSLSQIKQRAAQAVGSKPAAKENSPLKQQMDKVVRQAKKFKVWDNPKKQAKLEQLLMQLEELIASEDS